MAPGHVRQKPSAPAALGRDKGGFIPGSALSTLTCASANAACKHVSLGLFNRGGHLESPNGKHPN
jgi:hypothetical protein